MGIRITSWNVNGIRNPFGYQPWREKRTFEAMFDILEADIVVMQETKIQRKDLQDDMVLVPGWDVYFSLPRHKKGYAGVAIYTRNSVCMPIRAEEGITGVLCPPNSTTKFRDLPEDQQIGGYPQEGQLAGYVDEATLDSEGRCVILEFPAFVLIGTYSPAARDETRDDFRLGYMDALDVRIRNLVAMGKRVVLTGDLNVIRSAIDTAHIPKQVRMDKTTVEELFSDPPRRLFNHLLFEGWVRGERDQNREQPVLWDLGRLFHPTREGMYTCWDTKKNSRPANFGSRIDYVLCSDTMKDWFVDANIQEGLMGSDHCPVFATLGDTVQIDGKVVHTKDIMNPPGVFQDGNRLRDRTTKDLLPMSAKLIPEFNNRRSIKDMFFKKSATPKSTPTPTPTPTPAPGNESLIDPNKDPVDPTPSSTSDSSSLSGQPSSQPVSLTPSVSPRKPTPGSLKRTPSTASNSNKPSKKAKAALVKEPSSRGQSTLMGFFKSKATANPSTDTIVEGDRKPTDGLDGTSEAKNETDVVGSQTSRTDESDTKSPLPSADPEKVFDPIQNKESWSKILGKRVVPKCEHGDDCVSLVTKKPGINCGM